MLYAILITLIGVLIVRLFFLDREIDSVSQQLEMLNEDKTRKRINISLSRRSLVRLCNAVNFNIDKQEQARIEIQQHEDKLKQSIAGISHDLRTPLTSIIGYLTMLNDKGIKDEYIDIITHRAKALSELVNDFYELTVLEDEDYSLDCERLDIVALLTECIIGSYTLFEEKGIKPAISIPDYAVHVFSERIATTRILQNIITNAIKFSDGFIAIKLETQSNKCMVTIKNSTTLLTKDDVAKMFDRFYTADKSRGSGNTGLGLYIVKTLLDKMGGEVVKAELKEGIFEMQISLPLFY